MKASGKIFEDVQNHLVLARGAKNDLMLLRMKAYLTTN